MMSLLNHFLVDPHAGGAFVRALAVLRRGAACY